MVTVYPTRGINQVIIILMYKVKESIINNYLPKEMILKPHYFPTEFILTIHIKEGQNLTLWKGKNYIIHDVEINNETSCRLVDYRLCL